MKDKKYKIYYYYSSTKKLFIPNDDFCFENDGQKYEPFVLIIVDIFNEKGENFYDLLEKKGIEDFVCIDKINEKNIIEENKQKLEMLEEEKLEKKRIEKENGEKLKKKKKQEEYAKDIKKEEEYISPPYSSDNSGNTGFLNTVNQILLNMSIMQKFFWMKE